jgi:hypothetical protein
MRAFDRFRSTLGEPGRRRRLDLLELYPCYAQGRQGSKRLGNSDFSIQLSAVLRGSGSLGLR